MSKHALSKQLCLSITLVLGLLGATECQAWVSAGHYGGYHGGYHGAYHGGYHGAYHGGYYGTGYYHGNYYHGYYAPVGVYGVGAPGWYNYYPCRWIQQCYPNGTCVSQRVC